MKKFFIFLWLIVPVLLLATGCVSTEQSKSQDFRLNQLQIEVRDLKEQVKLRDMQFERMLSQTRDNLPDMRLEMDRLRGDLQRLTNMVETGTSRGALPGGESAGLQDQLAFIQTRLDRIEETLKLPPLATPAPDSGIGLPGEGPNPASVQPEPMITVQPEQPEPQITTENDESEYRVAEALYKQEVYPAALEKFRAFLDRFPQSSFGPSAQFYVGECLYQLKKYEEAILEYQKVIKKWPDNSKVSSSMLKQAFSFLNIGDKTSAKLLLQKIIRDYPDSYSAGVARKKLPQIK